MFCPNCGNQLNDNARFCNVCGTPVRTEGAPVAQSRKIDDAGITGTHWDANPNARSDTYYAGQTANHGQPRKKIALVLVVALVIALLAGTATAVLIIRHENQEEGAANQTSQTKTPAPEAEAESTSSPGPEPEPESEPEPEPEMTEEERAITSLEGWWESVHHENGYRAAFGHMHDGVIDWYNSDDMGTSISYSSTVRITKAERFAENGAEGWRFFVDSAPDESWAYYEADGNENELPIFKIAFGYGVVDQKNYNIYSVERYGMTRIVTDSPTGNSALFAKAQALAAERAGSPS